MNNQVPNLFFRSLVSLVLLTVSLLGISACRAQQSNEVALNDRNNGNSLFLAMIGYNYTNHYIDSYSVDGEGGGNIMVSSPTSGGSGVACCVSLSKDAFGIIRMRVRWQSGGCTYKTKSQVSGNVFENIHSFYKETDVDVRREIGIRPKFIEIHFYQDESVQAQLTEDLSRPRVMLDEGRADRTPFQGCKDDKKPS